MVTSTASVQYNDFKGTSAADFRDFATLNDFATQFGLDTSQYVPQGVSLYCGYDNFVSVSLLCEDVNNENRLIKVGLPQMPISEFLKQFKRLHIMLFKRFYEPSNEIEEIDIEDLLK
ncbi:MAG: hypothetical protein NC405_05260 [Odoribacter sp.]|nr:hypothetical protein [Odoribacter sp.]